VDESLSEVTEPLFVDRTAELAEFAALLTELARGRRRHLALLGLRRVGKTVLLDEVRRRHPDVAIAYLALDEVVSTPEDFARALTGETLRAAAPGGPTPAAHMDTPLRQAAHALGGRVLAALDDVLQHLRTDRPSPAYGALLMATLRFPAAVSDALARPLVVMLDEFQEITRLEAFPGTVNLLGTLRAALDRPGRVAFVVAGSRVTALRHLLGSGEQPLFTRFEQLDLRPFPSDSTHDLATRLWDEEGLSAEPDAAVRLHRLTGGWAF
jgi:AAA+ ATPase superfamily predicted ATPase